MNKKQKVADINRALKRVGSKAYAEMLPDKRIQYVKMGRSSLGKPYKMRASFDEMLSEMHGEDIRALKKKYGRK